MSIRSVMPSNHLILCWPILLLPSVFPSTSLFQWPDTSHQVTRVLELQLQYQSFWYWLNFRIDTDWYFWYWLISGLISFRIDWFDLFAMQRTLKSLLQHHTLKASVLRCSAFFKVKLSHQYMSTEKMIALTRQTFITMCYLCLLIHWVSHIFFSS